MDVINRYKALRALLPTAQEADFSAIPKDMDSPISRLDSDSLSEEQRVVSSIQKITLPCPVVPRYAHIESSVLSSLLGLRRGDVEWILRSRYGLRIAEDGFSLINATDYYAAINDGQTGVYIGAEAIEAAYGSIDFFEEAYRIESAAFDPTVTESNRALSRERAVPVALAAEGILKKSDFVLRSVPVLPFVNELMRTNIYDFLSSKISVLTYRLWRRARRLGSFLESDKVPPMVVVNEKRMIQEASDRLFAEYKLAGVKFVEK